MKEKLLIGLIVGVMALLSACGSSSEPSSEVPAKDETKEAATAPAKDEPKEAAEPAKDEPKETAKEERATAKTWYPIAEDEAMKWQPDAVLTSIVGSDLDLSGKSYPCDGKALRWYYKFTSTIALKWLEITVEQGEISNQREGELKCMGEPCTDETIVWYEDLYPASDWHIDSDEAVRVFNERFEEKHGQPHEGSAAIVFSNSKALVHPESKDLMNSMEWVASADPEGPSLQIHIDARTGEVTGG
jgi:hypothetical protein